MADAFDEMLDPDGRARAHYRDVAEWLARTPEPRIAQKRREAEVAFHRVGITFAVYGEKAGTERLIPFDIVPRIIPAGEWQLLDAGLRQRVRALNLFLDDIYHAQRILDAGVVPRELVIYNDQYRPQMRGVGVPGGHLRPHRRHRRGARRRRRVLRAGGQPARALGRVVHAREPQDDDAAVPGAVRAPVDRAGRALPGHAAREPALGRAGRGRGSDRGAADPGFVQLGLLRARLPRPADGHRAGRGPRPAACATTPCTCAPPAACSACT